MKSINYNYILTDITPENVNLVIKLFKENNLNVYIGTNEFDPEYPYLTYYKGCNELSQKENLKYVDEEKDILINNVARFLEIFDIKLIPNYEIY